MLIGFSGMSISIDNQKTFSVAWRLDFLGFIFKLSYNQASNPRLYKA
ncbi:hypothetical protein P700755_000273 [Psychroflexus torquis ATCC 700755]|uniref:Uncharacterized protein n=1 Tax=Psychroflexus torquis (strain ATCC 700755 / CIP 106069 / ACAM 623) TaxID=313595 RepID=K4IP52_PSYTT|nr:hypothetical protein P700755_000273 [Psychroflexus torquis ATCC 700755]